MKWKLDGWETDVWRGDVLMQWLVISGNSDNGACMTIITATMLSTQSSDVMNNFSQ